MLMKLKVVLRNGEKINFPEVFGFFIDHEDTFRIKGLSKEELFSCDKEDVFSVYMELL